MGGGWTWATYVLLFHFQIPAGIDMFSESKEGGGGGSSLKIKKIASYSLRKCTATNQTLIISFSKYFLRPRESKLNLIQELVFFKFYTNLENVINLNQELVFPCTTI